MLTFIIRRLAISVITMFFIMIVSWILIQLTPGDYVTAYVEKLMNQSGIMLTPEEEENLRIYYGVDEPQVVQFFKWVGRLLRGDLGTSFGYQRPIKELILERIPGTVGVTAMVILFVWTMGLPIGVYSALNQRSVGDYFWTFVGFLGLATPDFLLALIMIYLFYLQTGTVLGGFFSVDYVDAPWSMAKFWDLMKHIWIAAVVLGTSGTAGLIRVTRNNMLDELYKPYVVTAHSKGLSYWRAVMKYPFRIAFIPFASGIGGLLASLMSGSVIVSIVMDLRTVGPLLYNAIIQEDMFMAASIIMLLSYLSIVGVLISDLILAWVDPRIRLEADIEA